MIFPSILRLELVGGKARVAVAMPDSIHEETAARGAAILGYVAGGHELRWWLRKGVEGCMIDLKRDGALSDFERLFARDSQVTKRSEREVVCYLQLVGGA